VTLTTLLPSLRRSIPDPLDREKWPENTCATTTDVIVAGLSLLHVVELSGTPCSITGCSVAPGTHGRPSETHHTIVTVFRVSRTARSSTGELSIQLEADEVAAGLLWREARLIGRASTSHDRPASLRLGATASSEISRVELPGDLGEGDLIAVPAVPVAMAAADRAPRELQAPAWLAALA
jgi:hypothetical protein